MHLLSKDIAKDIEEEDIGASHLKHLLILILTSRARFLKDMKTLFEIVQPNTGRKQTLFGFDSTQLHNENFEMVGPIIGI